jgi:hypothetical protein
MITDYSDSTPSTWNPSTNESEAGRLRVLSQPVLHIKKKEKKISRLQMQSLYSPLKYIFICIKSVKIWEED